MEETYQLIEGSPTLRDLDAENGFLWCPFGHSGRQNEPGILISRLDDGSYDVRLGTGFDSPERFATGDPDWSWRARRPPPAPHGLDASTPIAVLTRRH